MKKFCFALLTVLFCTSVVCSAKTIELRSDRSAKAEIKEDKAKQNYTVKISFVPVSALDDVTNEEMTVILAQFFTEEALSIFLNDAKSVVFSGIHPRVLTLKKEIVSFSYVIPFKKVHKQKQMQESSTAEAMLKKFYASSKVSDDKLLTDFRSTCFRDLRAAELFFVSKIAEAQDKDSVEKKIEQAFSALIEKINNDDALFMSEKDELSEKAKKIKTFLLKRLHTSSAVPQNKKNNTYPQNISKAEILPKFKEFLLNDNVLLEIGGCRVFENASGKRALIAVGIAPVPDNSLQTLIDLPEIAETNAFNELAKHQEVDVTFFAERKKTTEIKTENRVASGTSRRVNSSRITVQAQAYIANVSKIGSWYSKDGKLFFIAIGCFLPR